MKSIAPHHTESEKAVLGAVIARYQEVVWLFNEVGEDDFYHEAHRLLWSAAAKLDAAGVPVDPITLGNELSDTKKIQAVGGPGYIFELADERGWTTANTRHHARIVREKSILRQMVHKSNELMRATTGVSEQDIAEGVRNSVETLQALEDQYYTIAKPSNTGASLLGDVLAQKLHSLENQEKTRLVKFGFDELDRYTGGMFSGNLIIAGGRQGMGKTAFATSVALRVLAASPISGVAFFTFEMTRDEIAGRVVAQEQRINPLKIKLGHLNDIELLQFGEVTRRHASSPLIIDDQHASADELAHRAERHMHTIHRMGSRLDLIVIDHLHIMGARDTRYTSEKAKLEGYTHRLKQLASDLNCPVLLLAQVTQEAARRLDDPAPRIGDFRGSSAMREDASVVLGLYRPAEDDPLENPRKAEVYILKNRDGDLGRVELRWTGDYTLFQNRSTS